MGEIERSLDGPIATSHREARPTPCDRVASITSSAPGSAPLWTAPGSSRRARTMGLVALAGIALLFSPFQLCFLALVCSVPCPGCGMTRAAKALAQGDLTRAFAIHPLSPVVVPLLVVVLATQAFVYVRTGKPFGTGRVPRSVEWLAASLAVLLLIVWVARFAGFFGGPVPLA